MLELGIGLGAIVGAYLLVNAVRGICGWLERKGFALDAGVREALIVGVQGAWDEFVRDLKAKAEDGRLTAEEKVDARARAKQLALEVAKGPVLRALKDLAPKALDALISLLVQRQKRANG